MATRPPLSRSLFSLALLGVEAQQVMWLRALKLAAGGASAQREANFMFSEKFAAAAEAAFRLGGGRSADSLVGAYRRKVRANARRLMKAGSA